MTDAKFAIADASAPPGTLPRMAWRILPLLGVAYLFAYMDRVNISFAALQMNADLGFSATGMRDARCTAPGLEWNRAARRPNGSVKREQDVPHSLENAIVFPIN